jgi:hypothetical protein
VGHVLWAFGKVMPALCWMFLVVGLAGAVGTAAGWLPPIDQSWWAKVTTILLWLLFAKEGYDPLAEQRAEAAAE